MTRPAHEAALDMIASICDNLEGSGFAGQTEIAYALSICLAVCLSGKQGSDLMPEDFSEAADYCERMRVEMANHVKGKRGPNLSLVQ